VERLFARLHRNLSGVENGQRENSDPIQRNNRIMGPLVQRDAKGTKTNLCDSGAKAIENRASVIMRSLKRGREAIESLGGEQAQRVRRKRE